MAGIHEALRAWRTAEAQLFTVRDADAPHGVVENAARELAHARREYEAAAVRAYDQALPTRRKRRRHSPADQLRG
jgi:hypothetical protein